jgi:hypothetical protein
MELRGHRIIGFSGHMTDAPDRASPRFPESRVPSVRARLRAALEAQGTPLHGVSSGARGGDLIFLEELLALGGSATILLPFPAAAFKRTSVGQAWDERFDRVLSAARVDVAPPLHATLPQSSAARDAAFEACNVRIVEQLNELAQLAHDDEPLFLAVFHESGAQNVGGTWDAIARWRDLGRSALVIDPLT